MRLSVLVLCVVLSGCAGGWEQVNDAFGLPMPEYDQKWNPRLNWTMEDIHVYVNTEINEDIKKYQNKTCLPAAERKYELALQMGYSERDLEIVVIKLSEDAALKADWTNGWPTHAVLRHRDTVYDNGFISSTPFDLEDLLTPRYGTQIPDVWSKYRKQK